jgi:hypothetical protein
MSSAWPDPLKEAQPTDEEVKKRREQIVEAEIDLAKSERQKAIDTDWIGATGSDSYEQKLHEALITLAGGAIDRARDGAKFVQTVAAALVTLYTGVVGLAFAASSAPLPARGVAAPLFLGLSMALAAYYLAFIKRLPVQNRPAYTVSAPENAWARSIFFLRFTRTIAHSRIGGLRAAVVALFFGVFLLPGAFVSFAPKYGNTSATAALSWPPIPSGSPAEAVAVLYSHQLDAFVKGGASQSTAKSGPDGADYLVGGVVVVGLISVWVVWRSRDDDPTLLPTAPPAT